MKPTPLLNRQVNMSERIYFPPEENELSELTVDQQLIQNFLKQIMFKGIPLRPDKDTQVQRIFRDGVLYHYDGCKYFSKSGFELRGKYTRRGKRKSTR